MDTIDARSIPLDPGVQKALAEQGLSYRLVDGDNTAQLDQFIDAAARGFLDPDVSDLEREAMLPELRQRRNTVVGSSVGAGSEPVATVSSWVSPLTVPGLGAQLPEIPMWAITEVTVASTHRRRGIARALVEGELRAAVAAGVPIAGLTVTESTIYGRFGFGPAVLMAQVKIDAARAGWRGGRVTGRVEYVDRQRLAADLGMIHERSRRGRAGQIAGWPQRWEQAAGLIGSEKDRSKVRGVRYVDAHGTVTGVMSYHFVEKADSFHHDLVVRALVTYSDEARSALWSFTIHHDLVDSIRCDLAPVDDLLPHSVANFRAVHQRIIDHGWVRILDVPAVLSARQYRSTWQGVLEVTDALDICAGRWQVTIIDGTAQVRPTHDEPSIRLGVAELSTVYLGGGSLTRLWRAGLVQAEHTVVAEFDHALRSTDAPALGIWY